MERVIALMLLITGLAVAQTFDVNKLKNGNVDQQGIRTFGNMQKDTVLNDPAKIRDSVGSKIGYDEKKLNGDITNIENSDAQQMLVDIMSKMSSSAKQIYRCYEERIVKIKNILKCSLTNDVFTDLTLCNDKCVKQHDCIQSSCIQTAGCERLTAGFVCPIQKTQCQTSISCPSGGTYNANTGKCETTGYLSFTASASYGSWIFKIEINNNQIRTAYGLGNPSFSSWISINGTGNTIDGNNNNNYKIWVEVNSGRIKLAGNCTSSSFVNFNSNFSLTAQDGCYTPYTIKFERSGNSFRVCVQDNCSSWATGTSCSSGYTYNPHSGKCETNPVYSYTCPYAGGTCVEQSRGIAYCSPYNCNSTNIGTWCATGNIDTTNMTTNSIGMWQCNYDSTWYIDEASCKTGCNYFQCSYNNNWYQGDKSVCELNCREQGQCTEVNQ